mmetsp:Transcript_8621/g.14986  ORF Transcript_8621/g.14986 Transcript_8621/m.14986 type:complete len:122 (-) Transcript_8621:182-547(-)
MTKKQTIQLSGREGNINLGSMLPSNTILSTTVQIGLFLSGLPFLTGSPQPIRVSFGELQSLFPSQQHWQIWVFGRSNPSFPMEGTNHSNPKYPTSLVTSTLVFSHKQKAIMASVGSILGKK